MRITLAALLWVGIVPPALAGDREVLSRPIDYFGAHGGVEFQELCRHVGLPCGIEWIGPPPEIVTEAGFRAYKVNLQEALSNLISGPMSGYSWRVNDGVIGMLPKDVSDGKRKSPLDTRLPSVAVDNMSVLDAAKKILEQAGLMKRVTHGRIRNDVRGGNVTVHLKDVTVRNALDALVRKDGQSVWMVSKHPTGFVVQIDSWRQEELSDDEKHGLQQLKQKLREEGHIK